LKRKKKRKKRSTSKIFEGQSPLKKGSGYPTMTLGELQTRLQEIANQSGNNIDRQVLISDGETLYQLDSVSLEGEVNLVFQLGEEADSSTGDVPAEGETPAP
jgi:hypothetical protein